MASGRDDFVFLIKLGHLQDDRTNGTGFASAFLSKSQSEDRLRRPTFCLTFLTKRPKS